MKLLKELKERWKAEIPEFWLRVKALAVTVTTGAAAVWLANDTMHLGLSGLILDICRYTIVAGVFTGLSAQMTKTDSNAK